MRPDLRLAFEAEDQGSDRRAAIGTKQPPLRVHPYLAVYCVKLTPDGDVWDGDFRHPLARFEFHESQDALDYAENVARDAALFARHTDHSTEPVKGADALVVNDHRGNELGRFHLGWLQVVQAEPPKKQTPWLWKMLGWK